MTNNLSVCVFIKDTFKGAFCLFESMYQLLPLADEFIVMDLGSTDGTLGVLEEIAEQNEKVKILNSSFHEIDAGVFASLANSLVSQCSYDNVLYYQSDEIWHEDLIRLMEKKFEEGIFDLTFWRIQYRENFQEVKWFPHPVHRVGKKENFNFVGDGMNTDRQFEPQMCSNWGMEWFSKWSTDFGKIPTTLPTNEMILDVSLVGGFLENIPARRRMHIPFWHEAENKMPQDEGGIPIDEWMNTQRMNKKWKLKRTPFNIPSVMEWHLGKSHYQLRPELLWALKNNMSMPITLGFDGEWR